MSPRKDCFKGRPLLPQCLMTSSFPFVPFLIAFQLFRGEKRKDEASLLIPPHFPMCDSPKGPHPPTHSGLSVVCSSDLKDKRYTMTCSHFFWGPETMSPRACFCPRQSPAQHILPQELVWLGRNRSQKTHCDSA